MLAYVRPSYALRNLSVEVRQAFADVLIWSSIIGWPLSALWFAKSEPQYVLGLSWGAILITGVDILFTSHVHYIQEDE